MYDDKVLMSARTHTRALYIRQYVRVSEWVSANTMLIATWLKQNRTTCLWLNEKSKTKTTTEYLKSAMLRFRILFVSFNIHLRLFVFHFLFLFIFVIDVMLRFEHTMALLTIRCYDKTVVTHRIARPKSTNAFHVDQNSWLCYGYVFYFDCCCCCCYFLSFYLDCRWKRTIRNALEMWNERITPHKYSM